jgi:hypothetical protein
LDSELLRQLRITFIELLEVVYEREHEQAARLGALQQGLSDVEQGSPATADGETQG